MEDFTEGVRRASLIDGLSSARYDLDSPTPGETAPALHSEGRGTAQRPAQQPGTSSAEPAHECSDARPDKMEGETTAQSSIASVGQQDCSRAGNLSEGVFLTATPANPPRLVVPDDATQLPQSPLLSPSDAGNDSTKERACATEFSGGNREVASALVSATQRAYAMAQHSHSPTARRPGTSPAMGSAAALAAPNTTRPCSPNRPLLRSSTAYAQPPATIMRPVGGGMVEGQLMYQLGKFAPLSTTYSPYWLKEPPQRDSVSDFRLSPSQRAASCYSPEFVDMCVSPIRATQQDARAAVSPPWSPARSSAAARIYARPIMPRAGSQPVDARTQPQSRYTQYINSVAVSSFHTGGTFVSTRAAVGEAPAGGRPNGRVLRGAASAISQAKTCSTIQRNVSACMHVCADFFCVCECVRL